MVGATETVRINIAETVNVARNVERKCLDSDFTLKTLKKLFSWADQLSDWMVDLDRIMGRGLRFTKPPKFVRAV